MAVSPARPPSTEAGRSTLRTTCSGCASAKAAQSKLWSQRAYAATPSDAPASRRCTAWARSRLLKMARAAMVSGERNELSNALPPSVTRTSCDATNAPAASAVARRPGTPSAS
eukprot:3945331-Prymnesium_polylepis.1